MNVADIKGLDAAARLRFTYKPDFIDTWISYADEVLAHQPWSGDCDDLVSTVLDLMARGGVPLIKLYRLVVISGADGATPDHMVGAVIADNGAFLVVGDTFISTAYNPASIQHKPFIYNNLAEAGADPVWRDGFPWQRAA